MTSEEKLTRIMNGGATPEHRIEMLRELIAGEVAKQLQKPPIPGPSFEGKIEPDKFCHPKEVHEFIMKRDAAPTRPEPTRPEIIPAEPLREMPEKGAKLWFVCIDKSDSSCYVVRSAWSGVGNDFLFLQAGLLFPNTPEGKLGAELRAKQGIVPYPEKSNPAKIESIISEIEKLIFEVQTETEFRSEFDFMNEKLEEIRNEVAKAGHITPAKALTEAPEAGDRYWLSASSENISTSKWEDDSLEMEWLSQGRIFPHNLRGKLGAAMFQEPTL